MTSIFPKGFYVSGDNIFVEEWNTGEDNLVYLLEEPGWILDFAFDGNWEINGNKVLRSTFRLGYEGAGKRELKRLDNDQSLFLSLYLHENPYDDLGFLPIYGKKDFKVGMAYPILKIISILKNSQFGFQKDISIKCYIRSLLAHFNKVGSQNCPYQFTELAAIFKAVSEISNHTDRFPLPSEIISQTALKKSRFQKACQAIYGQPAQKIIQDLKMVQAFQKVVVERIEIQEVSSSLGYHHSPNFITAFRNHFGLTPLEALHLHAGQYVPAYLMG